MKNSNLPKINSDEKNNMGFIVLTELIDDTINEIPEFALFCKSSIEKHKKSLDKDSNHTLNFYDIPKEFKINSENVIAIKTNYEKNATIISFISEIDSE